MTLKQLIETESQKQIDALAKMEGKLSKQAIQLQKELYELIRDKYIDLLKTDKEGKLLYNVKNLNIVNDFEKTWEIFKEESYKPVINSFAKDLLSIVDLEAGYFLAVGKEFDLALKFENTMQLLQKQLGINVATGELIEGSYLYRLFQGDQVRNEVADYVLNNVSSKISFTEMKKGLEELVKGSEEVNGSMTRYLRTYAYDTFSQVQGAIDNNIADTYDFNTFIYMGDVIGTTREFCAERAGGIYTRDDIEEWRDMEWQGKNWDVPFEESKGGYNCRHNLMWIPDEGAEYFVEEYGQEVGELNKE